MRGSTVGRASRINVERKVRENEWRGSRKSEGKLEEGTYGK